MSHSTTTETIAGKANKRLKMIVKENKKILRIAIGLLIAGAAVFVYILCDYWWFHKIFILDKLVEFNSSEDLSALGTLLAGTAGLFIGSSTIVFLIYNVKIQNASLQVSIEDVEASIVEMKESNANFLAQKKENLFFNLLDNHDKLINNYGSQKLNEYYKNSITKITNYHAETFKMSFTKFENTKWYIETFYTGEGIIKQAVLNAEHILNFIELNLDDKPFFYETFLNSLSGCIKYFLGYSLSEKLINPKNVPSKFQEEYNKHQFLKGAEKYYFPNLAIRCNAGFNQIKVKSDLKLDNEISHFLDFELNIIKNIKNRELKYHGYQCYFKIDGVASKPYTIVSEETFIKPTFIEITIEGDIIESISNRAKKMLSKLIKSKPSIKDTVIRDEIPYHENITFLIYYKFYFSYPLIEGQKTKKIEILHDSAIQILTNNDGESITINRIN